VALVFALLVAVPAAADMEVYHPRHRTGEDLRPLVEAVLGPEGSVAVDGHTGALVVIGSAEAIAQAMQLLAIQDRPLRTVLIRHETRTAAELASSGHRIVWSAGGDDLRVGNVESRESGAALVIGEESHRAEGRHASTLRVLEGEWGRIARGSEVLVPIGSRHHPDAVRVSADSGLEVRPRILGDGRVRLDLRPFRSRLRAGGAVEREGAVTTLVVAPGRPAVVGGIGRAGRADSGSVAGGATSGAGRSDTVLVVTATVEDVPSAE
jgi:type II secretory pathway component HofQ